MLTTHSLTHLLTRLAGKVTEDQGAAALGEVVPTVLACTYLYRDDVRRPLSRPRANRVHVQRTRVKSLQSFSLAFYRFEVHNWPEVSK